MKNKVIIFIILVLFLISFAILYVYREKKAQLVLGSQFKQTKVRVAVCPTCYELLKGIEDQRYNFIKTSSTTESLTLLQNGKVDMILSGRTLKPNELQNDFLIIRDGYSFLGKDPVIIYENELKEYRVYTDLEIEFVKSNFSVEEIFKVDDVYQYLDEGIIITTWENTDHSRAEIVQLLEENGGRVPLTRRPTIYCPNHCGLEAQEIKNLISINQKI